jgi:hypothetical protein
MNLFSAIAVDYHVSDAAVATITGFGGGFITAFGCWVGGQLANRFSRHLLYIAVGLASAACTGAMMLAPMTAATYIAGSSIYLLITGMAYASFTALLLEVIGDGGASAAAQYTLFCAAGNAPITYMTWVDGQGYAFAGARGLLGFDSAGNLIGALLSFLFLVLIFRRKRTVDNNL